MSSPKPGSFEYLEATIRRDAEGTLFGRDFEWVCQWYLEHAPLYRGKFRKVWRWSQWPDRWGPDCGIDLIAETNDGKLWAIQAKAVAADRSITKAEVDSFLAESNRRQIAYRLLIATTDKIGPNALRTIENQARHASVALRGDLVTAELDWPSKIGGTAPKPLRWTPKPHQQAAIKDVLAGFQKHDRGRLIMACGTGKTLTGLWINEALGSRRTLLLVPSISLVQQNLKEWGRHAREDFDCLVVCSDETVASDRDDPALRYVADLGIKPTTNPREIAAFLSKRRRRPALVISTYQSCERVARGQMKARKWFDFAICDEAHRLVGHAESHFATVLHDRKIRARRRLFMTATPRYFTQRAKKKGAEQEIDLVSMDDETKFGPEFHVLSFHDAITAKPEPLLTDYQVVVIGVTNAEAKDWVADAKLVRTKDGLETDARTLAAQIGLAKAVKKYDLTRIITFHRSIRRASRFVDGDRGDSLPAVMAKMRPANRPSGGLWARHVSGQTAASKRASLLKELGELPRGARGLISNCACLGEGVDVPTLDGVAFIDPKGSVVDIIQAVGRVIRKSGDKKIGTIMIPVFVDESEDEAHALESSAFQPVWQVLKALRAHDQRLADELDELRTSLGKQVGGGKRIKLPANIVLDVPRLLLADFEQAFYVRAIARVAERPPLTIEQILAWADEYKAQTGRWPSRTTTGGPCQGETWGAIDMALKKGSRGLTTITSIGRLIADRRNARNNTSVPVLSNALVLRWADEHYARHQAWPTRRSGRIDGTDENWANIDQVIRLGLRTIKAQKSLTAFLAKHRGVFRHSSVKPPLTDELILKWADEFYGTHGFYPASSEKTSPCNWETWHGIDGSLRTGRGKLKGGRSLWLLLKQNRGLTRQKRDENLSKELILGWADAYWAMHKKWPNQKSGEIPGRSENWKSIDEALRRGFRDLPPGGSLSQLLDESGRKRNPQNRPVNLPRVLKWARDYRRRHGVLPTKRSGRVPGTDETWASIDQAFRQKLRGITRRSSLSRFLRRNLD